MNTALPIVTIDRARLGRGALYDARRDCYCAMGFVLKACGVNDEVLAATHGAVTERSAMPREYAPVFFKTGHVNDTANWVWDVVYLNDGGARPPAGQTCEQAITALLEGQGFIVNWIN
jgi:hypothetical protein